MVDRAGETGSAAKVLRVPGNDKPITRIKIQLCRNAGVDCFRGVITALLSVECFLADSIYWLLCPRGRCPFYLSGDSVNALMPTPYWGGWSRQIRKTFFPFFRVNVMDEESCQLPVVKGNTKVTGVASSFTATFNF